MAVPFYWYTFATILSSNVHVSAKWRKRKQGRIFFLLFLPNTQSHRFAGVSIFLRERFLLLFSIYQQPTNNHVYYIRIALFFKRIQDVKKERKHLSNSAKNEVMPLLFLAESYNYHFTYCILYYMLKLTQSFEYLWYFTLKNNVSHTVILCILMYHDLSLKTMLEKNENDCYVTA